MSSICKHFVADKQFTLHIKHDYNASSTLELFVCQFSYDESFIAVPTRVNETRFGCFFCSIMQRYLDPAI